MYKIAILGTENTHAMAFSRYINIPGADGKKPFPDMEVIGVYGNEASTEAIMRETGVKLAARSPDEFLGKVDAVMVTARKGSLHVSYAKPYAEAGLPLFMDKPFTSDYAEAKEFIKLLKDKKVLISGGSAVKHSPAVHAIKAFVDGLMGGGEFITGTLNFNVVPDSEHDGLFFYASHLIETALAVFGEDVKTVTAVRKNDSITAVFGYENFDATLLFTAGAEKCAGTIYGKKDIKHFPIDISTVYAEEIRIFHNMLVKKTMPQNYKSMILPVKLIEKIDRAYKTGKTVRV
ncbi:hypothetical protein FACS1894211_00290 [Clostridia bacterium]|nr:hypothetical protein FACS1894211_00290 [Clostridia bacterium]